MAAPSREYCFVATGYLRQSRPPNRESRGRSDEESLTYEGKSCSIEV